MYHPSLLNNKYPMNMSSPFNEGLRPRINDMCHPRINRGLEPNPKWIQVNHPHDIDHCVCILCQHDKKKASELYYLIKDKIFNSITDLETIYVNSSSEYTDAQINLAVKRLKADKLRVTESYLYNMFTSHHHDNGRTKKLKINWGPQNVKGNPLRESDFNNVIEKAKIADELRNLVFLINKTNENHRQDMARLEDKLEKLQKERDRAFGPVDLPDETIFNNEYKPIFSDKLDDTFWELKKKFVCPDLQQDPFVCTQGPVAFHDKRDNLPKGETPYRGDLSEFQLPEKKSFDLLYTIFVPLYVYYVKENKDKIQSKPDLVTLFKTLSGVWEQLDMKDVINPFDLDKLFNDEKTESTTSNVKSENEEETKADKKSSSSPVGPLDLSKIVGSILNTEDVDNVFDIITNVMKTVSPKTENVDKVVTEQKSEENGKCDGFLDLPDLPDLPKTNIDSSESKPLDFASLLSTLLNVTKEEDVKKTEEKSNEEEVKTKDILPEDVQFTVEQGTDEFIQISDDV